MATNTAQHRAVLVAMAKLSQKEVLGAESKVLRRSPKTVKSPWGRELRHELQ
jgi:hypothetical protein